MSNTPALTKEQIKETRDLCLGLISGIPVGYAVREKADQCFALALSTLTPTTSGDGSERPKKPPLIPWPYLTYEEGKRVAPSLEPQVRALYNYVDALEVYVTKLEAERDAAIRAHK
jgi:hypothetical protein